MNYFCAQAVSKKRIEGVKLLGLGSSARLGGLEDILGGGVRKKTEILGGYQNISRHGKKFLFINAATRRGIPLQ